MRNLVLCTWSELSVSTEAIICSLKDVRDLRGFLSHAAGQCTNSWHNPPQAHMVRALQVTLGYSPLTLEIWDLLLSDPVPPSSSLH